MPEQPTPGQPPIENHRTVEYRLADHRVQDSGFTITPSEDGRAITVSGACPGCGGQTTIIWEYGLGHGYKGIFSRKQEEAPQPPAGERTVACDCGHQHANRPAETFDQGCGAYWQVKLP